MNKNKLSKTGFSLIEVLISLAILSIALSSLLVIRDGAIRNYGRAMEMRRMNLLLEQKMAELISGLEEKSSGTFLHKDYENYTWRSEISFITAPTPGEKREEAEKNKITLKKITLTVRHGESSSESLSSYLIEETNDE